MAVTQLSLTATPGRRYTFWPKSKGVGPFTELSVTATPGRRHSFTAKEAAIKGVGPFTMLSVMALPGMRQAFAIKTAAEIPVVPVTPPIAVPIGGGGVYYADQIGAGKREILLREDDEITEFIMTLVTSGILDN